MDLLLLLPQFSSRCSVREGHRYRLRDDRRELEDSFLPGSLSSPVLPFLPRPLAPRPTYPRQQAINLYKSEEGLAALADVD